MNTNRLRVSHAMLLAAVALAGLGLSVQACGGTSPDASGAAAGEKAAQTGQDLSIIGIQLPEPVVTVSVNDASVRIDPIGVIEELLPPQGIVIPDPLKPVNNVIGALEDGGKVGVEVPGVTVSVGLPGLPIPKLPDPFDGGIPIITP